MCHLDSKVKCILYKLALDKYSYESVVVNLYCMIVCIKSKREGLIMCDIYQPHIAQALLFSVSIYLQEEKNKMYISFLIKEDTDGGKPYQKRQLKNYAGFLAISNIA